MHHALTIHTYKASAWRWALSAVHGATITFYRGALRDFPTYSDALNAGTLALAAADGQPYENDAADPVGNVDCF